MEKKEEKHTHVSCGWPGGMFFFSLLEWSHTDVLLHDRYIGPRVAFALERVNFDHQAMNEILGLTDLWQCVFSRVKKTALCFLCILRYKEAFHFGLRSVALQVVTWLSERDAHRGFFYDFKDYFLFLFCLRCFVSISSMLTALAIPVVQMIREITGVCSTGARCWHLMCRWYLTPNHSEGSKQ